MKILQETKRLLAWGGLGRDTTIYAGGYRIPRWVPRFIVIFGHVVLFTVHSIKIYNYYPYGLEALLFPVHCIALNNMKLSVYCVLVYKTPLINELMDYLEVVVNERRFLDFDIFEFIRSFSKCLKFFEIREVLRNFPKYSKFFEMFEIIRSFSKCSKSFETIRDIRSSSNFCSFRRLIVCALEFYE